MQREVIFRDDQKIVTADLNNLSTFPRQSFDALVENAVSSLRYFTGFAVTATGATEVTVAPGHYWSGGPVYVRSDATVFNMLTGGSYMPVVTQRIVAVTVWGETIDTDVQDRSFVIDDDGNTEPNSVAMERLRYARLSLVPGAESPAPQKPSLDAGVIPVAWVRLTTSGIASIEMADDYRLPSVENLKQMVSAIEAWRNDIGQILDTILSELARTQAAIPPDHSEFLLSLLRRIEALEAAARTPATSVQSFIDRFMSEFDSDVEAAGYAARIDGGLRFPGGSPERGALALNNPLDPKVRTVGNIMLPAWSGERTRLSIGPGDAALSISQYTSQTVERVQKMLSRTVTKYGSFWSIMGAGHEQLPPRRSMLHDGELLSGDEYDRLIAQIRNANWSGRKTQRFTFKRDGGELYTFDVNTAPGLTNPASWAFGEYQVRNVATVVVEEPYWDTVTKDATVTGSQVAQTFINASNGWLTSVDVEFAQVDTVGDVHLFLVETRGGKPLKNSVISRGVVSVANLSVGTVNFAIDPVYTSGGKTYAAMLVSTGNHHVRVRTGDKYVSGAAYYLSDTGEWLPVQNSGDICLAFNYAQFDQTRVEVLLEPLTREGGIGEIMITAAQFEPEGTKLTFETQRAGKWYQISEGEFEALSGYPTLVNLRIVFTGTRDLMPGIDMSQTEFELGKAEGALVHFSKAHEPDSSTDEVHVHYYVSGWDPGIHSIDCDLILPGPSTEEPDSSVVILDPEDETRAVVKFVFTPTAATEYVVKTMGTTSKVEFPFVVDTRMDFAF